ncbi:MAG: thioester reductase domain-containing protein [Polyangiaceae bacterium]|nr:thioester reductase domain-containing protein [Polyangiaceae bacterium]
MESLRKELHMDGLVNLRVWLSKTIAEMREMAPHEIDPHERFHRYGLDSLGATKLAAALSQKLGRPLSPTIFWEYPTIEALARHLSKSSSGEASEVELQAKQARGERNEPIAIVGMACRFPGAPNTASFWQMLASGIDAVSNVPEERWKAHFDISDDDQRKIRRGAWLKRIDEFDSFFFEISPREARAMDPQQRLALELCWEALEDAGIRPDAIKESKTGVFAAAIWSDYAQLQLQAGAAGMDQHGVTGSHRSIIANRVSYFFGLQGPSFTVDAACSSGLVAVHLACESLRKGECNLAFAPAVNLNVLPESALGVARLGALSPQARCRMFDARADGYVRGEGGGVVVLKKLSDAILDGDRIHAIIRGSAVNNDGPSNGLTAPNPKAQEALLREAYERAGIHPHEVQYVEAHGTGTPLGDPMEAKALGAVFGAARPASRPLLVGSAKTNIGHLEGAAGTVGLIKVILSLKHRQIAPNLHFETANAHIPLDALRLDVPTSLREFPLPDRRLVAGVSSFGLGGTNAHVVLEEWPDPLPSSSSIDGTPHMTLHAHSHGAEHSPGVVFVFPGQGAQWQGMAQNLLQSEPLFRTIVERCDEHVNRLMGFSLLDELVASPQRSRMHRIDVSLPAIITLDIAMASLWQSLGVRCTAVVGHSTGEIAAAYVSGALDLADTMRVICAYGKTIARLAGRGRMLLVELPWERAPEAIAGFEGRVFPAIWDSAVTTVLAGEPDALDELREHLQRKNVTTRHVSIDVAPHCPLVDVLRGDLEMELRDIRPRNSRIPLISEVTGEEVPGTSLDAAHWVRNFADPARFSLAVDTLIARGHRTFLDVGPHPITRSSIEANLRRSNVHGNVLASMVRGENNRRTMLDSLAQLNTIGVQRRSAADRPALVPLSAKTPASLMALASAYADHFDRSSCALHDTLFTMSARRSHFEHRLAFVGRNKDEMVSALRAYSSGKPMPNLATGRTSNQPMQVVFVFPGQGSQWIGMGRSLLTEEPTFREAIEACDAAIQKESGISVVTELQADESTSRLAEIDVVQPVLFAISVALAALWRSWGVEPAAVVGHSMGEVAAAHVAGALSLDDATAIICRRSRLLRRVSGLGAMALVELTMADAERALAEYGARLSVAVSNGPRATVIAGDPNALDQVLAALEKQGVYCRRVKVDVASHSPQMDPLQNDLVEALQTVAPRRIEIPMISTVTDHALHGPELVASYWSDNLRRPVLFSHVIQKLISDGYTTFLEMSPHPILMPSVEENLRDKQTEGSTLASLRRGLDERVCMLESLGRLYVAGYPVNFERLYPNGGRVVDLTSYPWQRERHWLDLAPSPKRQSSQKVASKEHAHPILGAAITLASRPHEYVWEREISTEALPYLADHRVDDAVIFPGAGFIEAAVAATAHISSGEAILLEHVAFENPLPLNETDARHLQLFWSEQGVDAGSFIISSRVGNSKRWTKHASGKTRMQKQMSLNNESPASLRQRMSASISAAEHYRRLRDMNLDYGPAFQGVAEVWFGDDEVLGRLRLPDDLHADDYRAHPAWLDAALQISVHLLPPQSAKKTYVPVGFDRLALHRTPTAEAWVLARPSSNSMHGEGEHGFNLSVMDQRGSVLMEIADLRLRCLDTPATQSHDALANCVYDVAFRPLEGLPEVRLRPAGVWLIFSDRTGIGVALATELLRRDQRCIIVRPGTSFTRIDHDVYEMNIVHADDYKTLLQDIFGSDDACHGCVHLYSLDAESSDDTTLQSLHADLARGAVSATLLANAIVRYGFRDNPRLSLITRGARAVQPTDPVSVAQSPILGLGKTLALELPELECKRIDLSPLPSDTEIARLLREICASDREDQIALRNGGRFAARMVEAEFGKANDSRAPSLVPSRNQPFTLQIRTPGQLRNLALYKMQRPVPGPREVVIEVEQSGLNFRDVLSAVGGLPPGIEDSTGAGPHLGNECAGRVVATGTDVSEFEPNDAVIAIGSHTFGTFAVARCELVKRKPEKLTWDQASTIPIVFLTAHYALDHIARLQPGERILIHAGAGGVGLAAIQWAQHVGAKVFATAGSDEKRAYLRSLGVSHVFDSRSLDFVDGVKRATGGNGVDVVLNSLAGEFIEASLGLLREYGRFVEIGKRDIYENAQLGLRPFARNLSYSHLNLLPMLTERAEMLGRRLAELLRLFEADTLTPLPVRVFPISQAEEAFQFMAQAKHIGKIALAMRDSSARIVADHSEKSSPIRKDRTYLITGGLGGLGLSVARQLVDEGARSIVLMNRRAPSEEARKAISGMEKSSAIVRCMCGDVSLPGDVDRVFRLIEHEMAPLAGVIHAAAVLDDHTSADLSEGNFQRVFAPKAIGAWNLHTRTQSQNLDFFVLYSSVASLMGSPGQGNYCAANAFLDALAQERARRGLVAMSIQWGAFSDVGLAAAQRNRGQRLASRGTGSMSPVEGFQVLRRLLGNPKINVGIVRLNPRQWVEFYPSAAGLPYFSEILRSAAHHDANGTRHQLLDQLQTVTSSDRLALLEQHIVEQTAAILRCDASRIDRNAPFQTLGIDSLMSLELRNRLEKSLGIRLSATILFTHTTIAALGAHLLPRVVPDAETFVPSKTASDVTVDNQHDTRNHASSRGIAVIGMACRFPAGSNDPHAFWRALHDGANGIVRIPAQRWPADAISGGQSATRWAGLLDAVDEFDSAFFGISPREAAQLDPQQRFLLEVTYEALERGGQTTDRLANTRTGIFVGMCSSDYMHLLRKADHIDAYTATGNMFNTAAGRISYTFGFNGPCMTVDTACSSSLAAVHMALQSLRNGECDVAIAGGVNLLLDPVTMRIAAETQALSPDGRCRTFDAAANGFVRGEGCGILLLKRLADAERDGDSILAVIRGSVMNQDGRSTGLTAPNVLSQQAMLRQVLEDTGVSPNEIGYVETHGTGTSLGDPIEFEALREVLGKPRPDGSPCVLGAVKTNIGHLEAAAGVAGLIKAILSLEHEAIPPNLHFKTLNPRIDLEGTPFVIPTRAIPWVRQPGKLRRAGVSSFGISGTNVHVLLEEPPMRAPVHASSSDLHGYLLPLSAKTPAALIALAHAYAQFLATSNASLDDIVYTASVRRNHFEHRAAILGSSKETLAQLLRTFAQATESAERVLGAGHGDLVQKAHDYVSGRQVDWNHLYPSGSCVSILPTYQWQRQRHWFESPTTHAAAQVHPASTDNNTLEEIVLTEVARILRLNPLEIDKTAPFGSMGMDSLMSLELRNRLEAILEHRLSAAMMLAHPSVSQLTEHLSATLNQPIAEHSRPAATIRERRSPGERMVQTPALLTGATGFLGVHLLRTLILAGAPKVYCLVRADTEEMAMRRLRAAMRHYCGDTEIDWSHVVPLLGDMAKQRLGLDEPHFHAIGEEVGIVYNNGAMLDFVMSYDQLAPTNVHGTAQAIKLALQSRRARFCHISTVGVLPQQHPRINGRLAEVAAPTDGPELISCGYTQTKRAAENIVLAAMNEGLHAIVHRPAVISGSTATGTWNLDDAMCRILKGCIQAECVPDIDWRANLVPVDFVADAIVHISTRTEHPNHIFHLANIESTHFSQIVDHMRHRGYKLTTTSHDEWLARIERQGRENALEPLIPWIRRAKPFLNVEYDCTSLTAALKMSSLHCPIVDSRLLDWYFDNFIRAGFVPPPR